MYLDRCEIVETGDGTAVVRGPCRVTGKTHQTPAVPLDALVAYVDGAYAQDAFPMLPPEEREFLISGTSPEGWRLGILGEPETPPDEGSGQAASGNNRADRLRLSEEEGEALQRVVDYFWADQRRDFEEKRAEHGYTNWDAEWHEHIINDLDKLKSVTDRVKEKQVLATRGEFALIRSRHPSGKARYSLERDGYEVCCDADGDCFYVQVGMVSGSWELWLATGADENGAV